MNSNSLHSPNSRPLTKNSQRSLSNSVSELGEFLRTASKMVVITGAGISSGSGIPTYRDDNGNWKSSRPIQHGEFMRTHSVRQRYWARSYSGWPTINEAAPNHAHAALAKLEAKGVVRGLVTQNVDRLHQRAGHKRVIDLHGRLDQVLCMDCGAISTRAEVQQWLQENNPQLSEGVGLTRPDGDADVDDSLVDTVNVPNCERCAGLLKPNVVFYGSSVEKSIVSDIYEKIELSDAVLIVGSSLTVFSSFRFCKFAHEKGIPLLCINQGLTRADDLYKIKVAEPCGKALQTLEAIL
ncbi:MAG: NAD-dependent protein deacetylase [Pseudohongiellaceae bacterium]